MITVSGLRPTDDRDLHAEVADLLVDAHRPALDPQRATDVVALVASTLAGPGATLTGLAALIRDRFGMPGTSLVTVTAEHLGFAPDENGVFGPLHTRRTDRTAVPQPRRARRITRAGQDRKAG
jgi:hypothetical protein